MLYRVESSATTMALTSIRAFEAGPSQMRDLIAHPVIRRRLDLLMRPSFSPPRRPARRRSSAGG